MQTVKHQLPKLWEPKHLTKTTINKWRAMFNQRNPAKLIKRQTKVEI